MLNRCDWIGECQSQSITKKDSEHVGSWKGATWRAWQDDARPYRDISTLRKEAPSSTHFPSRQYLLEKAKTLHNM